MRTSPCPEPIEALRYLFDEFFTTSMDDPWAGAASCSGDAPVLLRRSGFDGKLLKLRPVNVLHH